MININNNFSYYHVQVYKSKKLKKFTVKKCVKNSLLLILIQNNFQNFSLSYLISMVIFPFTIYFRQMPHTSLSSSFQALYLLFKGLMPPPPPQPLHPHHLSLTTTVDGPYVPRDVQLVKIILVHPKREMSSGAPSYCAFFRYCDSHVYSSVLVPTQLSLFQLCNSKSFCA